MANEEKIEIFKLVKKEEFNRSNFKDISPEAEEMIAKSNPKDLLVLTITNNSPTLSVTNAEPFTEEVFDKIIEM